MKRLTPIAILCAAVMLGATAVAAAAVYGPGNPTRAEYVANAERICSKTNKQIGKLIAGANKDAKAGNAKGAGKKLVQVGSALGKGVGKVAKLPRPTADKALLGRWIKSLRVDAALVRQAGKALVAGDNQKVSKIGKVAGKHAKRTNALVADFGFRACRVNA